MSARQRTFIVSLCSRLSTAELHHGDCIGADADMHDLAKEFGFCIILHPPIKSAKRAFCKGADEEREPKEYIPRDHDIVDETEFLIATPNGTSEILRSGTWATIRYARKLGRRILIVYPDGSFVVENDEEK